LTGEVTLDAINSKFSAELIALLRSFGWIWRRGTGKRNKKSEKTTTNGNGRPCRQVSLLFY